MFHTSARFSTGQTWNNTETIQTMQHLTSIGRIWSYSSTITLITGGIVLTTWSRVRNFWFIIKLPVILKYNKENTVWPMPQSNKAGKMAWSVIPLLTQLREDPSCRSTDGAGQLHSPHQVGVLSSQHPAPGQNTTLLTLFVACIRKFKKLRFIMIFMQVTYQWKWKVPTIYKFYYLRLRHHPQKTQNSSKTAAESDFHCDYHCAIYCVVHL